MSLSLLDCIVRAGMDIATIILPCMALSGAALVLVWRGK
jgi:hypothetical protein